MFSFSFLPVLENFSRPPRVLPLGFGTGHYTAYGKSGDEWLLFNDSMVSKSSAPGGDAAEALERGEGWILNLPFYRPPGGLWHMA